VEESEIARRVAEVANKAKSEFIGNMSHELRTPLNSILGFTQVLEAGYYGPLNEKQKEYMKDINESGRHLLDVVNPDEEYHVARYVADAAQACREIIARGKRPLLVGGTGLYLKGLLEGLFEMPPVPEAVRDNLRQRLAEEGRAALFGELGQCDPESAARIHANDTHRLLRALEIFQATGQPWSAHLRAQQVRPALAKVLQIGLHGEREALYERINLRVEQMVEEGLLAEVEKLLALGYDPGLKAMQSIGYRHMLQFLQGQWDWEETLFLLARDTRRYAKRQMTWFGSDPFIRWFAPSETGAIFNCVESFFTGAQGE